MFALAFAGRHRGTRLASELTTFIQHRYSVLAGGGLTVVVITGLINLQRATPTGWDFRALLTSGTGRAYFVLLGVKLSVAAMSISLSIAIGRLLNKPTLNIDSLALRSLGAAAAIPARLDRVLRLSNLNAMFGSTILLCVIALHQLHLSLHGG